MLENPIVTAAKQRFRDCLTSEMAEEFLQLLLGLMSVAFTLDRNFKRHITGFSGRYMFMSSDGVINLAAIFADNRLEVREKVIRNPDITITFKNGKALMGFLLAPKPDILGSILNQEVRLNGNLNYLYKFAFMAKRMQLSVTGVLGLPGRTVTGP